MRQCVGTLVCCQCELVCVVSMTLLLFQHSHDLVGAEPDQLLYIVSHVILYPSLLLLLHPSSLLLL